MSYLVIARKYRPIEFADVVGQETIIKTLKNAITEKRVSQAYLFSGTRGVGKTTVARIFARAINCEDGPTVTPCGKCPSCTDILNGNSLDVIEIDGASNRRVEETQQLIENVKYAPSRDRYKVYIIDEVHMLSNHAFNALLKTLEEPPSHVVFIMATTEYHKIPQTIRSRTQHFHFANISQEVITSNLRAICDNEKIKISSSALSLIAKEAKGSVRDAQSLLDQVISFSGENIDDDDVGIILGTVSTDVLDGIIGAISNSDSSSLMKTTGELYEQGFDLMIVIRELIERIRLHLLLKVDANVLASVTGIGTEESKKLSEQGGSFSVARLLLIFDILSYAEYQMKYSSFPRYIMETALIKTAISDSLVEVSSLIENHNSGEGNFTPSRQTRANHNDGSSGATVKKSEQPRITGIIPVKRMSEEEAQAYIPVTPGETAGDSVFSSIMSSLEKYSKGVFYSIKANLEKIEIKDNELIIYTSHRKMKMLRELLENNRVILNEIIKKHLGTEATFKLEEFIPDDLEETVASDRGKETVSEKAFDTIRKDPIVQKILDKFGGDIKDFKKF